MSNQTHKGPHKYLRIPVQGVKNRFKWRCVLEGCSHWVPHELILFRECICWRCGDKFIIEAKSLLRKPHCEPCTKKRSDPTIEAALKEIPESPI